MNAAVAQLINEQINKEFYSAYLYLDFANYYAAAGLDGFENWYRVQAQEERDHALLFFQYLLNNGVAVSFGAIVSMFRLQRRHARQLSFAPLPGAFELGPGIVLPQPRPLHSGQTLHFGPMRSRARCKTSL